MTFSRRDGPRPVSFVGRKGGPGAATPGRASPGGRTLTRIRCIGLLPYRYTGPTVPLWPSRPSNGTGCQSRHLPCIPGLGRIGLIPCRLNLRPKRRAFPKARGRECYGPPPPIRRVVLPGEAIAGLRLRPAERPGGILRAGKRGGYLAPDAARQPPLKPPRLAAALPPGDGGPGAVIKARITLELWIGAALVDSDTVDLNSVNAEPHFFCVQKRQAGIAHRAAEAGNKWLAVMYDADDPSNPLAFGTDTSRMSNPAPVHIVRLPDISEYHGGDNA